MTSTKKLVLVGGIGIGAYLLFPSIAKALGLKGSGVAGKPPGQPIGPTKSIPQQIADALKSLGSGGGFGFGGGSGSGGSSASPSKTGGVGTGNFGGGNFGSYVVQGQLYDKDGNALDDNGNVIPGVYDNSGLGPAGAGINFDGSIATNPLEYATGSVISLNTPSLDMSVDNVYTQSNGGDTQGFLADARASSSENAPELDTDLTAALLPSTPLPNLNVTSPTDDNLWAADSAINNTPPDIAYGSNEYVDSFPPADASNDSGVDNSASADNNNPYTDSYPTDYGSNSEFATDYGPASPYGADAYGSAYSSGDSWQAAMESNGADQFA